MSETGKLLHHVPGRLRLRLPFAKADPARLEAIQSALGELAGVRRVNANPTLGTVVVQYDPALFAEFPGALEKYVEEQSLFTLVCEDSLPCISEADRSINRVFRGLNHSVQLALGNLINLKELLPFALAIYGLFFVNR